MKSMQVHSKNPRVGMGHEICNFSIPLDQDSALQCIGTLCFDSAFSDGADLKKRLKQIARPKNSSIHMLLNADLDRAN